MAITPKFAATFDTGLKITDATPTAQPSLTWGMELDGDRCIGKKDDVAAIVQSIFCTLSTEQGAFIIYPASYGLKMSDLWGKPTPYMYAVLCDRIEQALLRDDRILAVDNFSYEATGESMLIRYDVHVGYTNDEIIPGVLYVR